MSLPKVRLRTLMIIVAIAALECRLLIDNPLVGILFLGPLIGSPLLGILAEEPHHRHLGLLLGGIVGGVVETGVLWIALEGVGSFRALASGLGPDAYRDWLVAGVIVGFGVGLTFGAMYSLRLAIVCPAYIVEEPLVYSDLPANDGGNAQDHPSDIPDVSRHCTCRQDWRVF